MEMMAMVYIADMALKNRRWDEDFDPKPPGYLRRLFNALSVRIAQRRMRRLGAEKRAPRSPAATRCNVSPCPCYVARRYRFAVPSPEGGASAVSEFDCRPPQAAR